VGLLRRGQEMLNRRLKESDGGAVTYVRHSTGFPSWTARATVTARVGRSVVGGLTETAVTVQYSERDYLIDVADLALPLGVDGTVPVPTTPAKGDRIVDGDDVWEVMPPTSGEPCWKYSDAYRTVFRVHVRRANRSPEDEGVA